MWKVTIKGLLAHKLRLVLTGIAIVLGVTFISGTLVLTDTLHNTFTTLFGHIYQNIDFQVRGKAAFTNNSGAGAQRKPIAESIINDVRGVPGVSYASGQCHRLRPVHRSRREGSEHGRCPDHRTLFRPQSPAVVAPPDKRHPTHDVERRRHGRGHGGQVPLQGR